ncbi:hypothetical protein K1T35_48445 (plasmid) [Pseudonocardia sp. DSM 110487]|uniref:hypothetical protein n=1 Tax=Pseudonocardia sp. DSM 110487 TaxID=2865833 RepID=UPI001C69B44D|nr:hypothetical protein [Pseudonocardia sp. DSM 110487]QYN41179.1 hypothetical protein K1T35_48445 [Pseudonocardia sp. DSM 110487]
MAKVRPVDIVTEPEQCETGCGARVAITRRRDDGATRLSVIGDGGRVWPGGHTQADCRGRRGL